MFQPVSLFIGLRYSRSRSHSGFISFITFFSIAGILLGVTALIIVVSVMNGFEGELKKRILGLVPHVIVAPANQPTVNYSSTKNLFTNWPQIRTQLLDIDRVQQVSPLVSSEALIQSPSSLQGVLLQGIIPKYEQHNILNSHMVSGSLNSLNTAGYHIVMGVALARKLKVTHGDRVRIILPNKMVFTPMGRVPVQRTFIISGLFNLGSQVDDSVIYIKAANAAKLLRKRGDGINQLRLYLDDAFVADQVANVIPLNKNNFQITTWKSSQGTLFSAVRMEKNMMWLMLSLIIAVATFNIVSALVMVVIEKQGEIAILQTLGLSQLGVVKIFITQGMINGLWGVTLGAITGVLITLNLNDLLAILGINIFGASYANQQLPVQLEIKHVVVIITSALLMCFISTLYPAFRASKTQPAEVLRNE
jgi:lipoprotein-releasing system permease protein